MDIQRVLSEISIPDGTCEYWDVRVEDKHETAISYDDYELISCAIRPSLGAFIRVYNNGMWYYSSTTDLETLSEQIIEVAKQAKSHGGKKDVSLKPYNTQAASHELIRFEDIRCDKVSIERKRELCESYFETLKSNCELKNVAVHYVGSYLVKYFRSSEEVNFVYDQNKSGLVCTFTVIEGDGRFVGSHNIYDADLENLFGRETELQEIIDKCKLFPNAENIDAGTYPVVMSSLTVGVFAHESFGHKSEADYILGDESAIEAWKIGSRVGAECLSIVDVGDEEGTSGYCPIDDEGFPTQKTYLIEKGILKGRLHSQMTAQVFDEAPTGNGRAKDFEFEPIVRMTNTYVEPEEKTFEELIANVKLGVFVENFTHGTGMSTFTIAPSRSYMIRDGKIAEAVKVSVISGNVFETLKDIEGCSKDFVLKSSAFGGCGKNEQAPLPVGFGGPQVLVKKMVVS